MSTHAYWIPVSQPKGTRLSDDIKRLIALRYLDHDGTLCGTLTLDSEDVPWLEGLRDAGIADSAHLIAAIERYDSIKVWID